ncbi:putative Small acidic protein family [Trypanosoma vivax]|uniref:Small acidic protein n=1 Tax=Trypanosoma vivax (strain Y486) TaxID=1055687 RepID=G0UCN1_TRYVY|nr:hypothetical protein TRVL_04390 [Trypanosoma vivax]KAH8608329.1 putative Small acidic protein family [Trypanosoma vivax]CCC53591.1 conserved hypothetical protein [Trypanosoma vivax Y486]
MVSLKTVARELRMAAADLAESRGMSPEELTSRDEALLFLAVTLLKELEASSSSDEVGRAAREARQTFRPWLPRLNQGKGSPCGDLRPVEKRERQENPIDMPSDNAWLGNGGGTDLGQYAKTPVFTDNAKKRAKFSRLMGGSKHEQSHHNTFAADEITLRQINSELEEQFNTAVLRSGKKGLGA